MSSNRYLRSASVAALAMAAGLLASAADAQTSRPAPRAPAEVEEVVVTGSILQGTPEDAALPVNVIGMEELKKSGSPTTVELVKRLNEVGQAQGDQQRFSGLPQGAGSINFRNLLSSRSLVVFNGRRVANQPGSFIGRFQNTNLLPTFAMGRLEILRQGGAVTYGADGVGGVANYITQKGRDAGEVGFSVRHTPDAEAPDWDAHINWGKTFDRGDVFFSAGYQVRQDLRAMERDFIVVDYLENPNAGTWTALSNPGAYQVQLAGATQLSPYTTITPGGAVGTLARYVGDRQMGVTGVIRDKYCQAVGGFEGWSATPSPICYWRLNETDYLTEHQETQQYFVSGNYEITDKIRFHTEWLYSKYELPDVVVNPVHEGVSSGPYGETIGLNGTFFTSGANPAVAQFLNDYNNVAPANAALRPTAFTAAQIAAITNPANPGRVALPNSVWRLVSQGGAPRELGGEDDGSDQSESVSTEMFRFTNSFSGEIGRFLGIDWSYDVAHTYSFTKYRIDFTETYRDRFNNALQGFGSLAGRTPCPETIYTANPQFRGNAAAGCYWLNPFSSAVAGNAALDTTNPGFVGAGTYAGYVPGMGLQNSPDLIRWMQTPGYVQRTQDFNVVDFLLTGKGPFELPGGPLEFGVGAQYRLTKDRQKMPVEQIISYPDPTTPGQTVYVNPCPTPQQNAAVRGTYRSPGFPTGPLPLFPGCPVLPNVGQTAAVNVPIGMFMTGPIGNRTQGVGQTGIAGVTGPSRRRFPVHSAFFEVKLPVFDWLNFNVAGRYEKFISDQVGGKDNEVFVPAASMKWRITDSAALRAGWGESFTQVDPPAEGRSTVITVLNGQQPGANILQINNTAIRPERGEYYYVGGLFQKGGFQGAIDYWSIEVNDLTQRTITSPLLLTAVTVDRGALGNALLNCNSPLLTEVQPELIDANGNPTTFFRLRPSATGAPTAACVQGVTNVSNIGQATLIPLTNSGTLSTSGVDMQADWTFDDVWGGTLNLHADATLTLSYKLGEWNVGGVRIAPEYEGVGTRNSNIGGNGQPISRWRGGFSVNYNHGRHNLNVYTRYIGAIIDDNNSGNFQAGNVALNANVGDANGTGVPCASNLGNPANAGTADNTGPFVNGSPVPVAAGLPGAGSVGFQGSCTIQVLTGRKIPGWMVTDVTYSVDLPWETKLSFSIFNILNEDPPFSRDPLSYNHYLYSPLGRNYKISVVKRF